MKEKSRPVSCLAVKSPRFVKLKTLSLFFPLPPDFLFILVSSLWDFVINLFLWSKSWTWVGKTRVCQPWSQSHTGRMLHTEISVGGFSYTSNKITIFFFFILNVLLDKKQIVHLSCSLNFCWVCYIVMLEVDLKSRFYQVTRAAREELSRSHSRIFLRHPGCPR